MRGVGVIYLYRFSEGEAPVLRFLESYFAHPAGLDHDFNVVFKGFPDSKSLARGKALFKGVSINAIDFDDCGYDLGSYLKAATALRNARLIFFNTFSRILADNWLAHFNCALDGPKVGLVGATGSWAANTAGYEATFRFLMLRALGQPAQYYQLFEINRSEDNSSIVGQGPTRSFKSYFFALFDYSLRFFRFGRFPNPHIRTNAFMIDREVFLSLDFPAFTSKLDAYKFESGRRSMTKQILKRGLRAVVVDRGGKMYDVPDWKRSSTFRIDEQANLIVADNRTVDYAQAGPKHREYMQKLTWVHPWYWDSESPSRSDLSVK